MAIALPLDSLSFLVGANAAYLGVVALLLVVCFNAKQQPRFRGLANSAVLRNIIAAYNVVCITLAAAVVVMLVQYKLARWRADTNGDESHAVCTKANMANGDGAPLVNAMWLFYGQKFWEYLDTVFFILKGSRRQVSFLHVYHHCSVTAIVWVYLQLMTSTNDGGTQLVTADGYIPAFLNSFVHVLLYSHYFMRLKCKHVGGAKPWWAPYLTKMQLVQFFIIAFAVACAMLLPRCECVHACAVCLLPIASPFFDAAALRSLSCEDSRAPLSLAAGTRCGRRSSWEDTWRR